MFYHSFILQYTHLRKDFATVLQKNEAFSVICHLFLQQLHRLMATHADIALTRMRTKLLRKGPIGNTVTVVKMQ